MKKKTVFIILLIILASFAVAVQTPSATLNWLTKGLADTLYCSLGNNCEIRNANITGNFSAKRAYLYCYDNTTQNFLDTNAAQVVNLTNNNDSSSYLIHVIGQQNITFEATGEYLIVFSPEFYQSSGTNKIIAFWIEKNGLAIPWSNSRYTILNGQYFAPSITYQITITKPLTDVVRLMWYSDSTNTQMISITGLVNPTRPAIPSVLLSVTKISEIPS